MTVKKRSKYLNSPYRWIVEGLIWGTFMFVMIEILFPKFDDKPYDTEKMIMAAIFWTIGGLVYGFINDKVQKYLAKRKKRKEAEQRSLP